jgi:hypothetical protein
VFSLFVRLVRGAPRLPAERRPGLDPGERVVAWAPVGDDGPGGTQTVVVTNRGLWLPGEPRLAWHLIHKAVWSGRQLTVTPAEVVEQRDGYDLMADLPPRTYLLLSPDDVPEQVRARVTGSVAYTQLQPAPGGGRVRIVARRVSGVDGLTWAVRADAGVDVESVAAREALGTLVARARAQLPGPDG